MAATLHPLAPADRAAVEALYEKSVSANPQGFIQDLSYHGNIYDLFRRLAAEGGAAAVMKNEDGAVIGIGGLRRLDEDTAELCNLHLDAAYHGQGLGRKLSSYLLDLADQLGFSHIELHVTATQTAAIRLYKKLGFTEWQRQNYAHTQSGVTTHFDTLYMQKLLSERTISTKPFRA